MTWRVLVPDRLAPPADVESAVFGDQATVTCAQAKDASEISDDAWAEADAVLAWHELVFDEDQLAKMRRCRVIVRVGVGFDNVDLEAAGRAGIAVYNVPDYGTDDVADHAMAMALSLARGIPRADARVRASDDNWRWGVSGRLRRLTGATLGIVGLGRIGTAVARRAQGFGLAVHFYDPAIVDGLDKALGVTRAETLEALAAESDIVTLHTPLTDETRGMAADAFFGALKPGAILVNTSRGPVVDLDALERALRDDAVAAAGFDVLPEEPPDPDHPLIADWRSGAEWLIGRLIITPHCAFWCDEAYREMREKAARTALRHLEGAGPRNLLNGPSLRPR